MSEEIFKGEEIYREVTKTEKAFRQSSPGMGSERQLALINWNVALAKMQAEQAKDGMGYAVKLEEKTEKILAGMERKGARDEKYYRGRYHAI